MAKAVKLADIAEQVGVSTVTVSKALSGQKGVSEEMREKIKNLAEELRYSDGFADEFSSFLNPFISFFIISSKLKISPIKCSFRYFHCDNRQATEAASGFLRVFDNSSFFSTKSP